MKSSCRGLFLCFLHPLLPAGDADASCAARKAYAMVAPSLVQSTASLQKIGAHIEQQQPSVAAAPQEPENSTGAENNTEVDSANTTVNEGNATAAGDNSTEVANNATEAGAHSSNPLDTGLFIFGYGSLMKKMSRMKTKCSMHSNSASALKGILEINGIDDPIKSECMKKAMATPMILVNAKGVRRGWYSRGKLQAEALTDNWQFQELDLAPTYLGAVEDPASECFAVIYPVDEDELALTDKREGMGTYHAAWLDVATLDVLTPNVTLPQGAKVRWYAMDEKMIESPTRQFPICQSYVDLVIGGAMELGQESNVPDFAKNVAATTDSWSSFWVNDRKVPYRPFAEEALAHGIVKTLIEASQVNGSKLTRDFMSGIRFPDQGEAAPSTRRRRQWPWH